MVNKFYAVRVGRHGPNIYTSWSQADASVSAYPGARHKSFRTEAEAHDWLQADDAQVPPKRVADSEGDRHHQPAKKRINSLPSAPGPSRTHPPKPTNGPLKTSVSILEDELAATFSPEQKKVFDTVSAKQSLFFTGSAGTGKSFLLRAIIKHLRAHSQSVAVTASTGIAASHLQGTTLHAFAGIGLGQEKRKELVKKIRGSTDAVQRWQTTDVLIIDEISMIEGDLLDKIEYVARSIRHNEKSFGGIQLILAGDFFQLPPVARGNQAFKYAFQADCWTRCVPTIVALKSVFRQKDDRFVELLNEMRTGCVSTKNQRLLESLKRPVKYNDGILPSELYPKKDMVDAANWTHLSNLRSPGRVFKAKDRPGEHCRIPIHELTAKLNTQMLVQPILTLKIDAQVMLLKNMPDHKLVNGSVGVVVGFSDHPEYRSTAPQEPRPASGEGFPVVKFTTGAKLTLAPISFDYETPRGNLIASREQVPLMLAWALSIHKSQGQTLERVIVDLKKSFEKGQVYVALSRATSLNSLQVLHFHPSLVQAHPAVLDWARSAGCD